jgi:hypothetical protein
MGCACWLHGLRPWPGGRAAHLPGAGGLAAPGAKQAPAGGALLPTASLLFLPTPLSPPLLPLPLPQFNLKPWDVAAGICILEEAGGRVSTADGLAYSVFDRSLLATNDAL